MKGLDGDAVKLLSKRVYDLAGITASTVSVHLNGKKIKVNNFKQYCELYLEDDKVFRVHENTDKWDICVCASPGGIYR